MRFYVMALLTKQSILFVALFGYPVVAGEALEVIGGVARLHLLHSIGSRRNPPVFT